MMMWSTERKEPAPYVVSVDMEIPLQNGMLAVVDDADAVLVADYAWQAIKDHGVWYVRTRMLRKLAKRRITIYMHHLILGKYPGAQVDHRDGDGLNNRRSNLRLATHSQNQANQLRLRPDNTTGFKGVIRCRNKWQAKIWNCGKVVHLGTFSTAEQAAAAYDRKALELFGEFAATNAARMKVA